MPHLSAAKAAIEAEIKHAKLGLAHYQARVEALEKAIGHIVALDQGVLGMQAIAVSVKPATAAKSKPAKYSRKSAAGKPEKSGNDLPFTGGDYWPNLITTEPRSGADVLRAAIADLGFRPSKQQVLKLTQRLTFALNTLVKAGKIQDSGKGRERRFFKG